MIMYPRGLPSKYVFKKSSEDEVWQKARFQLECNNGFNDSTTNSFGFRSEEFFEKADIVGLGCSYTYGCGVPVDKSWGEIVSQKLNLKYHNLSGPGRSVMWTINNFFNYVNKFGNPKIVLALFPNFSRMEITSRLSQLYPKNNLNINFSPDSTIARYGIDISNWYDNEDEKYLKKPIFADEIIPAEMSIDLSLEYIKMLEMYCNTNKIDLIWSTWSHDEEIWLEKNILNTGFKNFKSLKLKNWHNKKIENSYEKLCVKNIEYTSSPAFYNSENVGPGRCISDLDSMSSICPKNVECHTYINCHDEFKNELYFNVSSDAGHPFGGHFGWHRHLHIAEDFIDELSKNKK